MAAAAVDLSWDVLPLVPTQDCYGRVGERKESFVLQALDVGLAKGVRLELCWITMWDGSNTQKAILSHELHYLISSGRLQKNSIFLLKMLKWKFKTIILKDIEILVENASVAETKIPSTLGRYCSRIPHGGDSTSTNPSEGSSDKSSETAKSSQGSFLCATASAKSSITGEKHPLNACNVPLESANQPPKLVHDPKPDTGLFTGPMRHDAEKFGLSSSALQGIIVNGEVHARPLLKVLGSFFDIDKNQRLLLTDGALIQQGVLIPELSTLSLVQEGTVVQLLEYFFLNIDLQKHIIILKMDIIAKEPEIRNQEPFSETTVDNPEEPLHMHSSLGGQLNNPPPKSSRAYSPMPPSYVAYPRSACTNTTSPNSPLYGSHQPHQRSSCPLETQANKISHHLEMTQQVEQLQRELVELRLELGWMYDSHEVETIRLESKMNEDRGNLEDQIQLLQKEVDETIRR